MIEFTPIERANIIFLAQKAGDTYLPDDLIAYFIKSIIEKIKTEEEVFHIQQTEAGAKSYTNADGKLIEWSTYTEQEEVWDTWKNIYCMGIHPFLKFLKTENVGE